MSEGKEEIDLEQQQCQEMESRWWCNNERIRHSVSGWYKMWDNTGGWTIKASESSEMGSSPVVATMDHTTVAVGTDPASSSEAEAGQG